MFNKGRWGKPIVSTCEKAFFVNIDTHKSDTSKSDYKLNDKVAYNGGCMIVCYAVIGLHVYYIT